MVDNDGYTLAPHGMTGTSCVTPHSRALPVTYPRPLPVVLLLFMDVSFSFFQPLTTVVVYDELWPRKEVGEAVRGIPRLYRETLSISAPLVFHFPLKESPIVGMVTRQAKASFSHLTQHGHGTHHLFGSNVHSPQYL